MKQDKHMDFKSEQNFSLYRPCRSKKKCEQIFHESRKYGIQKDFSSSDLSYVEIINKVIETCEDDFALVCHDDVILPIDIARRVNLAIQNAKNEVGENWGIIGNFGKEFLSHKKLKFVRDLSSALIPPSSVKARPVIAIDDNTLLLNIKTIKEKKINLPALPGVISSKLWANILLIECYRQGLVCLIDSNLFAFHKDFKDILSFEDKENEYEQFSGYWRNLFINHRFITIHKSIDIKNSLDYLKKDNKDKRVDLYKTIESLILKSLAKEIEINIVIRSMLNRPNLLNRSLELIKAGYLYNKGSIKINVVISANNVAAPNPEEILESIKERYQDDLSIRYIISNEKSALYPRVQSIKNALDVISNKESFVWIVDDDDFIFPNAVKYFASLLDSRHIFVGDSVVFEEVWSEDNICAPVFSRKKKIMNGKNYFEIISGHNNTPVCSVIYPTKILHGVFLENNLNGDYAEDYAIFLLALRNTNVFQYPLSIAGISYHGANTVLEDSRTHWDYSYTTFMSEVVNSGIMREWTYDYIKHIENKESSGFGSSGFFGFIKNLYSGGYDEVLQKAYKTLKKKGLRKSLRFAISYMKHGRKYFKDGVNALDERAKKF